MNQPSDAFFTLEIQPKKPVDRKKEVMRYRFVTKTIKKAGEICDFSETFLAQLAKAHLNVSPIYFYLVKHFYCSSIVYLLGSIAKVNQ